MLNANTIIREDITGNLKKEIIEICKVDNIHDLYSMKPHHVNLDLGLVDFKKHFKKKRGGGS